MIIETDLLLFWDWFPAALATWGAVVGVIAAVGLLAAVVGAWIRVGPAAGDAVYRGVVEAAIDLTHISPRRVWALARLAIVESLRKHAWIVLVLFVAVVMFSPWFIGGQSPQPEALSRQYLDFTYTWCLQAPVLVLVLLLTVFSLPQEMKTKTIHTVVTKPVRASEIVLGRMLGFTLVGAAMLAVLAVGGYIFLLRVHAALPEPYNRMAARAPISGKLRFLDREGQPADKGISVGKEWTYRSWIQGGSLQAAVWRFSGVRAEQFPDGLRIDMRLGVFRTHKGVITRGVKGSLVLRDPRRLERRSQPLDFISAEYEITQLVAPRKLLGQDQSSLDLFADLAPEGDLEILLRCDEEEQLFGVAQADLYLRAADASFTVNYLEGLLGIFLQMALVVGIGVTCGAFLSGGVAMLATTFAVGGGLLIGYIRDIAQGTLYGTGETNQDLGGGPLEAGLRMFRQDNIMQPLEAGADTTAIKALDEFIKFVFQAVAHLLPDLPRLDTAQFVAQGYVTPPHMTAINVVATVGYLLPLFIAAYFLLKTREVAQ